MTSFYYQQIIQDVTGQHSNLVRAPYGSMPSINHSLRDQVANAHLKLWDWTMDSLDWKYNLGPLDRSIPAIVDLVVFQATRDKEVILLHDIHVQSVQAVPLIIQKLTIHVYLSDPANLPVSCCFLGQHRIEQYRHTQTNGILHQTPAS